MAPQFTPIAEQTEPKSLPSSDFTNGTVQDSTNLHQHHEPCVQSVSQELKDVAAVAGHLELPLSSIEDWTPKHKHTWLKCMLVKNINWQAMEPNQRVATANQLNAINDLLRSNLKASLDSLIGMVESILACQVIGQILCDELQVWRRAAKIDVRDATSSNARRGSAEGDRLWQHIVRLLESGSPCVRWIQPELGRFQFLDSSSAARSWGVTKRNRNMSFEKMSRSIRQYYKPRSGLMTKLTNKGRLHYQFNVMHPKFVRFLKENFPNSACLAGQLQ